MRTLIVALICLGAGACAATSHPTEASSLGRPRSFAELEAVIEEPGPIRFETVVSADWAVSRAGLIDLDHPAAKRAGLEDGDEPIKVYFHVLRHPERGLFLVDSGVEDALRDAPDEAALRGPAARFMNVDKLKFRMTLGDFLRREREPLGGILLTHLHLDHVAGMPDAPDETRIYTGPFEAESRAFLNAFSQGPTDRALEGKPPLSEWPFALDSEGPFPVVDVFGDRSLFALFAPGHTPGSTAYLVRTTEGPVLLTGDACHTRWGWENGVPPGNFTADHEKNAEALAKLRELVREHPSIDVRLGHQP